MEQKVRAVFAWTEAGYETAVRVADLYRKAGMEIFLYGLSEGGEALVSLGEEAKASHVLYFMDAERISMVSLTDEMGGFTVEVRVSDLILPQKK